jgi:hypothetical protein
MDSSGESTATQEDSPDSTDVRDVTEDDKENAEAEKATANELFKGMISDISWLIRLNSGGRRRLSRKQVSDCGIDTCCVAPHPGFHIVA